MRERIRRRLRKLASRERELAAALLARHKVLVDEALLAIALDPAVSREERGKAARLLGEAGDHRAAAGLVKMLWSQTDEMELWQTGLAIESSGDLAAIPGLLELLDAPAAIRQQVAARVLGWISWRTPKRVVDPLARVLSDTARSPEVRQEAAESIAYLAPDRALDALVAALCDAAPIVRFFAVFALGHATKEPRVLAALEGMLQDEAVPAGWWSIRREALSFLGGPRLQEEVRRIENDTTAPEADLMWAARYADGG